MRTLLSQFCDEFGKVVQPLLGPLRNCADKLSETSEDLAVREALPPLLDLRHELQQLADKVAEQQAYVLIFGPLKSGKSTLMNAVSSAYVSEVSCLPAYPCMVFVGHAPERKFVLTRYNGQTEEFTDPLTMRMHVGRAHTDLAQKIREVERDGKQFDPPAHYPDAIRRIDVKLPARALESSSAVLVDTPGLYSRMKFGYDRMTREFRNTAACAIFVVKTDNLFLEQVFEEFNQLLNLFSRIFLVVNLDTQKNDLRPDGTLAPSLEREDPVRVIEAFENLAMSAPLKAAAEDGRLGIYPIDLQRAASLRLKDLDTGVETETPPDFEHFQADLENYLNSTDYLVAFLGDSLRHAEHLVDETGRLLDHEAIREMDRQVNALQTEMRRLTLQGEVLQRLEAFGWKQAFEQTEDDLLRETRGRVQSLRKRSEDALYASLESWFDSDGSLASLLSEEVVPELETCQTDIAVALHQALSERVGRGCAGLELPANVTNDVTSAELMLSVIGRHSLLQVDPTAGMRPGTPDLPLDTIPVKKSFWDWILFRSQGSVRKRVFGSDTLTNRISRTVKQKKLGDEAFEQIWQTLATHLDASVPQTVELLSQRILGGYSDAVQVAFGEELTKKRSTIDEQVSGVEHRLEEVQRIADHVSELERALGGTRSRLEQLSTRYGETDPASLSEPVPEDGEGEPLFELQPNLASLPEPSPEPAPAPEVD